MTIEVVSGVEGNCLSVDDTRVAGPKPWGGGKVIQAWSLEEQDVRTLRDICNKCLNGKIEG